jgi:hypothetical protein
MFFGSHKKTSKLFLFAKSPCSFTASFQILFWPWKITKKMKTNPYYSPIEVVIGTTAIFRPTCKYHMTWLWPFNSWWARVVQGSFNWSNGSIAHTPLEIRYWSHHLAISEGDLKPVYYVIDRCLSSSNEMLKAVSTQLFFKLYF